MPPPFVKTTVLFSSVSNSFVRGHFRESARALGGLPLRASAGADGMTEFYLAAIVYTGGMSRAADALAHDCERANLKAMPFAG
jgi:hypothetical protein